MNKKAEIDINPTKMAQKILNEVPQYNAFYFFYDINNYTGVYARSLDVFSNQLKTINKKSIDFHFKRGDFENWIRFCIGDTYLANEIGKINEIIEEEEELIEKACKIIENRLSKLKKLLAKEQCYVDHDDDL